MRALEYRKQGIGLTFNSSNYQYGAISNLVYNRSDYTKLTIIAKINTTADNVVIFSFDRSEYFRFGIGSTVTFNIYDGSAVRDLSGNTDINDGNDHIVAVTFDNGVVRMYVDGKLDKEITGLSSTFGDGMTRYGFIGVGSEAGSYNGSLGPENYYDGDIYWIQHFRGRALSLEEINRATYGGANEDNLEGYWLMNEGEGTVINDISNNYDVELFNSPTWFTKNESTVLLLNGELSEYKTNKLFQLSEGTENLQENPSFELGNLTGYSTGYNSSITGKHEVIENNSVYNGKYVCKAEITSSEGTGDCSLKNNTHRGIGGDTYTVSCRVLDVSGNVEPRIRIFYSDGDGIYKFDSIRKSSDFRGKLSVTGTVPDGYYIYSIWWSIHPKTSGDTGYMIFDECQIEKKEHSTPFVNGTREGHSITVPEFSEMPDVLEFKNSESIVVNNYNKLAEKTSLEVEWKAKLNFIPDNRGQIIWRDNCILIEVHPDGYYRIRLNADGSWQENTHLNYEDFIGEWHTGKLIWDGNEIEVYINDNLIGNKSYNYDSLTNSLDYNLDIGMRDNDRYLEGFLSYLKIKAENQTVGLWKLNEGQGTTVYDYSGNENHGEINGASWVYSYDGDFTIKNGMLYIKGELSEMLNL